MKSRTSGPLTRTSKILKSLVLGQVHKKKFFGACVLLRFNKTKMYTKTDGGGVPAIFLPLTKPRYTPGLGFFQKISIFSRTPGRNLKKKENVFSTSF